MPSPRPLTLLAAVAVAAALSAPPATAGASACDPVLTDGTGVVWKIDTNGTIIDAGEDTYDSTGSVNVDANGDNVFSPYPAPPAGACSSQDGGSQTRYPSAPV